MREALLAVERLRLGGGGPGGDSMPRTFRAMKEPYRLVHWAHQARPWRKTQAPLAHNTTRNRLTRCGSDNARERQQRISRRGTARDTAGPRGVLDLGAEPRLPCPYGLHQGGSIAVGNRARQGRLLRGGRARRGGLLQPLQHRRCRGAPLPAHRASQ
jgi:hypothetical protein